MKKLLSLLLTSVVITAAAVVPASAMIYFSDSFDTFKEDMWLGGALFTHKDGISEGWGDAVVDQIAFTNDEEVGGDGNGVAGPYTKDKYTYGVDLKLETDSEDPACGLWVGDYYGVMQGTEEKRSIFTFMYRSSNSTFYLMKNCDDPSHDFESDDPEDPTAAKLLGTWEDPAKRGENLEKGDFIKIAIKVEEGKISAYVDGNRVITAQNEHTADLGKANTPFLIFNRRGHVILDNIWVGSVDELPDAVATEPAQNTEPANNPDDGNNNNVTKEPETEIITKVIIETDANGETHKVVETEKVTKAPVADTNKNPSSTNNNAQTGDMVVVVVAVMVVALGSAIVVKKYAGKE